MVILDMHCSLDVLEGRRPSLEGEEEKEKEEEDDDDEGVGSVDVLLPPLLLLLPSRTILAVAFVLRQCCAVRDGCGFFLLLSSSSPSPSPSSSSNALSRRLRRAFFLGC